MSLFDDIKALALQTPDGQDPVAGTLAGAIPGGLGGLLSKLQAGGLGDQVSSWLGDGHNLPVSADQLQGALGDEHVQQIAQHLGLSPDQALQGLAEHLPGLAGLVAAR